MKKLYTNGIKTHQSLSEWAQRACISYEFHCLYDSSNSQCWYLYISVLNCNSWIIYKNLILTFDHIRWCKLTSRWDILCNKVKDHSQNGLWDSNLPSGHMSHCENCSLKGCNFLEENLVIKHFDSNVLTGAKFHRTRSPGELKNTNPITNFIVGYWFLIYEQGLFSDNTQLLK